MAKKNRLSKVSWEQYSIEFANNGIIIRNPYNDSDVQIVPKKEEEKAIGKKIKDRMYEMLKDTDFPVSEAIIKIEIELKERIV